MDYKRRAGLYLLRKKGKTISIFLLVVIVSTFLISCFALLNASENLASDIRQSIGAAFYLRASTGVVTDENGEMTVTENNIHITEEEIEQILNCGDISYTLGCVGKKYWHCNGIVCSWMCLLPTSLYGEHGALSITGPLSLRY